MLRRIAKGIPIAVVAAILCGQGCSGSAGIEPGLPTDLTPGVPIDSVNVNMKSGGPAPAKKSDAGNARRNLK